MRKAVTTVVIGMLTLSTLLGLHIFNSNNALSATVIAGGHITADETWFQIDSPYYIEGDVYVDNGANLTIEGGVEVLFNYGFGLYINNGTLRAVGTATNMIKFTSNDTIPQAGNWSKIQINSTGHAEITYCNITYGYYGIYLDHSSGNRIQNNIVWNTQQEGIFLDWSDYNYIQNNSISKNWHGVHLFHSSHNTILNNSIHHDWRGIYLSFSEKNNISLNSIFSNSGHGIGLSSLSHNNNIAKNNFTSNGYGIFLSASSNNRIYHNIFWENTEQAFDQETDNYWDNGFPSGGNYWSDFDEPSEGAYDNLTGPYQDEEGSDGIVDDPYLNIGGGAGATDRYPLIAPSITRTFVYLNSPINNSVIRPGTVLDFIIVGDDIALVNYSVDFGPNKNLSSPWDVNGTETGGWLEGTHVIDIFVYDSEGNETKFTFNITIDPVKPEIILNSPPNGSLILPGVEINLTVLDDHLHNVTYVANDGANTTLPAPYNIDTSTWEGNYIIDVYAVDLAGNLNTTQYNFTIDGSGPSISLIPPPANNSFIKNGTLLRFSISDPHLNTSAVNYSVNGIGPENFTTLFEIDTTDWPDDNYLIEVNASDTLGNRAARAFNFTVDSTLPLIFLNSPDNNSVITAGVTLYFYIFDDYLKGATYVKIYDSVTESDTFTPPYEFDTISWVDGVYNITIEATDEAGNINSSFYSFTIATPPLITLIPPPNNNTVIKAGEIIDLYVEDSNLDEVNYSVNDEDKGSLDAPDYDINTTLWDDGNYIIEVHAVDKANNKNSKWYNFTIDSTPPTIIFNTTSTNYVFLPGTLLDFDVYDENLASVNISIDGGDFNSFPWPYIVPTGGWDEGDHSIVIGAVDDAKPVGNENISEFTIIIDSTPPIIKLLSPFNGTSCEIGALINLSIIEDNLDFVNYSVNFGEYQTLPSPFSINTTNFPDGNVTVLVYAVDLAGNSNTTWYEFIFNDTTKPYIILNSPENLSVILPGTTIDLHVFDIYLRNVSYSLDDGDNFTLVDPYDIGTSDWEDGEHTLRVYADDARNNVNISVFIFIIDSEDPQIVSVSPQNNSVILPGELLDFYIIEDNLNTSSYSKNDGPFQPFSGPFNINTADWDDGIYEIVIMAEDKAGNKDSARFRFIIDSTPPEILLNSPLNGSIIPSGTIIDITILDANLDIAEYSLNDGEATTFSSPYDINTTGWKDGNHTIYVHASDPVGNTMNASFTFILDSTPPGGQIVVSAPFYPYDRTSITIYFTETMDKESVESALNITPGLNYTIAWYDDDRTLMLKDIEGLELYQTYSVGLDEGVKDLAGNLLINVSTYDFTATIDHNLDTDEDGMPDGWEFYYDLDPSDPSDAEEDADDDGYTNLEEFEHGSNPTDPNSIPLKAKEKPSTLQYWWLIPILVALLVMTIVLFMLLMGERKEEPKGPVEELEDMYLAMRAEKDIKAMESMLSDKEKLGERLHEAEIIVQKAKEAFENRDYNLVTVYEKTLRDLVGEDIEEGEAGEEETE